MFEENKNISIEFTGQSVILTNQKSITKDNKNNGGYETEQNLYKALKEYAKISQDSLVIFHSLDLFDYQEKKFVEKDFLIANVSKSFIISIEAKKTLDKKKTRCAIDQLKSAKTILEQYNFSQVPKIILSGDPLYFKVPILQVVIYFRMKL